MKYLLLLLVLGLVLWKVAARLRVKPPPPPAKPAAGTPGRAPAAMVACAHCGLHLPAADALLEGSHIYCSPAHRALGPRTPPA
ncbi:PP0621 family protein [Aquabacterium sp. OR-4]|uniref:PP0621 family protein n=1 Tax=Aquabacterium sp. OR-4 TaxID=2978127 RepID=UPI0021B324E6|nr:PP0621 family protein [Aquabacterium sp. OR-4]MDT7837455.1 PP0621 family protein [Aquabacterium sp. OR-4]